MDVPLRYATLAAGAVLVLAVSVYLFIQVHAAPARADSSAPAPGHADHAPVASADPPADPAPAAAPALDPGRAHRDAMINAGAILGQHPRVTRGATTGSDAPGEPLPEGARSIHVAGLERANPKNDAVMLEASKAYDRGDTDEARDIAKKVLAEQPGNVRMLRILVSTACIDGDAASAKANFALLPTSDQAQMRTRCDRYGITFPDAAPPAPVAPAP